MKPNEKVLYGEVHVEVRFEAVRDWPGWMTAVTVVVVRRMVEEEVVVDAGGHFRD
ncbi:hypothetical protein Hanom_Chr06g00481701 [Helianthus anomalus]